MSVFLKRIWCWACDDALECLIMLAISLVAVAGVGLLAGVSTLLLSRLLGY
jgi:hypothetical protein